MPTIVLTGGGTAGHCTPNVALIPLLKKHFNNIHYIGSTNGIEKNIISKTKIPYHSINCAKLKRKFCIDNFKLPFVLAKSVKSSGKILDKIKPDVIFSKGGFVSVPTVIAAKRRNIPVISHESDLSLGLANKITSKLCKKVLTSFPETASKLKNGVFVGPPIRDSLYKIDRKKAEDFFGFNNKKPVVLITGGSQGAKAINESTRSILNKLLLDFNVIHLCGKNNADTSYNQENYRQIEYLDKIEYAFVIADVCVSRAGSNTIFELLSLGIPTLLIPLPKDNSRGDQIQNAKYFAEKGLCKVLFQEQLNSQSLLESIYKTHKERNILQNNIKVYKVENSCPKIVDIIKEFLP